MDDCGSLTEPETLMALSCLCRDDDLQIVLAGDVNAPLAPDVHAPEALRFGMGNSLLSRLVDSPLYQVRFYYRVTLWRLKDVIVVPTTSLRQGNTRDFNSLRNAFRERALPAFQNHVAEWSCLKIETFREKYRTQSTSLPVVFSFEKICNFWKICGLQVYSYAWREKVVGSFLIPRFVLYRPWIDKLLYKTESLSWNNGKPHGHNAHRSRKPQAEFALSDSPWERLCSNAGTISTQGPFQLRDFAWCETKYLSIINLNSKIYLKLTLISRTTIKLLP